MGWAFYSCFLNTSKVSLKTRLLIKPVFPALTRVFLFQVQVKTVIKMLASTQHQRFSDSLNGQCWRLLKSGLDDFRNGFPLPCDNFIIRSPKGLSPILLQNRSHLAQRKAWKTSAKPNCKLRSKQEARKDFMKETDHHLGHHPQLFHSHLKDSSFPEVKIYSCCYSSLKWLSIHHLKCKTSPGLCSPLPYKCPAPHYYLQTGSQQSLNHHKNKSLILL